MESKMEPANRQLRDAILPLSPTHEYAISDAERARIENNFTYHSPITDQPRRYQGLREEAKRLAYLIEAYVPDSREKSLALTNLEGAIMWANAGIARNEK